MKLKSSSVSPPMLFNTIFVLNKDENTPNIFLKGDSQNTVKWWLRYSNKHILSSKSVCTQNSSQVAVLPCMMTRSQLHTVTVDKA